MKTPRVATIHNDDQRVKPGPPYPSGRLPCDTTLGAIHGWPMRYPFYHLRGMVGYRPTQRSMKLVSLWDPVNPILPIHNQRLFIQTQLTLALINIGGGYHLGALNL
jgi:hypothetical protein